VAWRNKITWREAGVATHHPERGIVEEREVDLVEVGGVAEKLVERGRVFGVAFRRHCWSRPDERVVAPVCGEQQQLPLARQSEVERVGKRALIDASWCTRPPSRAR